MSWIYVLLLQLYLTVMELTKANYVSTANLLSSGNRACCNGTLGFAGPYPFIPCSEMRCCNSSETVALERPKELLPTTKCYSFGQEVATTNDTNVRYELRTCCRGLKFKVISHTNDVAMVIKCVRR